MTVREWFRLQRAALWEKEIGVAVEYDKLSDAIAEGNEWAARAALEWLLLDNPYMYSRYATTQLRKRHRYRGIDR